MKKFSLSAIALATLALTACGGGSDGTTVTTTTPTTDTTTPTVNPVINVNSAIVGNRMQVRSNLADAPTAIAGTSALNKVVIDGKELDFIPDNKTNQPFIVIPNSNSAGIVSFDRIGSGNTLSYTRYGYIRDGYTGTPYLFAQGEISTNVPTTGTATYTGYGTQLNNSQLETAESRFDVDYANKKLTGYVGSVSLEATITGNSFAGTKDGYSTTGNFFGANAAELGGTYKNADGNIAGAYGAKK